MNIEVPASPFVSSYQGVDDVVLSLTGVAPPANIRLTSQIPKTPEYQTGGGRTTKTTLQIMLELGFSSFIEIAAKTNLEAYFFLSDTGAYFELENPDKDSIITSAKYGVAVRVGIAAFNLDASVSVSAPSVAAAATLKLASTTYEVMTLGIGLDALHATTPLINNTTGPYDLSTLDTIALVQSAIDDIIFEQTNSLVPILMSVNVDTNRLARVLSNDATSDYSEFVRSQIYGVKQAWYYNSLEDAIADIKPDINPEVLRTIYSDVLNLAPGVKPEPGSEAFRKAEELVFAGR